MPLGATGDQKNSGRFLHRDRPLANIYVNNQKVLFDGTDYFMSSGIAVRVYLYTSDEFCVASIVSTLPETDTL